MFKEFKTLFSYFKKYKWAYISGIIALIITDAVQLYIPILTKKGIDFIENGSSLKSVGFVSLSIVVCAVIIAIGRFLWRYTILGVSRKIETDIRHRMFKNLLRQSLNYYKKNTTGEIMAKATSDTEAIRNAMGMGVVAIIDASVMMIATLSIMITMFPNLTLATIIPLPIALLVIISFARYIRKKFKATRKVYAKITVFVQEKLSGIKVIKGLNNSKHTINKFSELNQEYKKVSLKAVLAWSLILPLIETSAGLTIVILLRKGGVMVVNEEISIGDFVAFMGYLALIVWPILSIGFIFDAFQRGSVAIERINKILFADEEISEIENPITKEISGDIKFENVYFKHSDSKKANLKNINFSVKSGQHIGIFGKVGSGKSSLINSLTRLFDVEEGCIKIDNIDIKNFSIKTLRENIAVVPQESILFSDTIKNNIAFGKDFTNDQELESVAKASTIYKDFGFWKDGWNTVVGEKGVTISGGQKQRIAISRALLINAPIMIFDDAFSSVDVATEEKILNNIKSLREGKTTIFISHRVSTLKNCSKIIILVNGEIADNNTFSNLIKRDTFFTEVYRQQQDKKPSEESL